MKNLAIKLEPEALQPAVSFPKTKAPEDKKPFSAKIIRLDDHRKRLDVPKLPEIVSGCSCCCE